jgi:type VI secretion system protein ImpL
MIRNVLPRLTLRGVVSAVLILLGIGLVVQQSPRFAYAGYAPFQTATGRAWLTLGLLAFWLLCWGIGRLARRVSRVRISWDPAPAAPAVADTSGEARATAMALARVDCLFRFAHAVLRNGGPLWRLRRHSLYRLPWYVVLGEAGSGKTSLLSASRLPFLQASDAAAWQPGDPCRFWLGDQAVLVEASPPASSATSYPVWQRVLMRLRRARPRCPVNGAIVTLQAAQLLAAGEEVAARAVVMRAQLEAMQRCLRVRFPIYVVVTHCDRLHGFDTFFQQLDRRSADQVWGVTLPFGAEGRGQGALAMFQARFAALVLRLQERVVDMLAACGDAGRAGKVYGFPAQLEALGQPLGALLDEVFTVSPYAETPWLRGVYFTSAAQDGGAALRCASPLAAAVQAGVGRPPQAMAGRHGYFINHMLRQVIFKEHWLAGRGAAGSHYGWLACYALGVVLTAAVLVAGLVLSYRQNADLVAHMQQDNARLAELAARPDSRSDPAAMAALLDLAVQPVPPGNIFLRGFGLYQGYELERAAQLAYQALLRETVLPFVQAHARAVMLDRQRDGPARFGALRTYLMLSDPRHYDADAVMAWARADAPGWSAGDAQRTDLLRHARALFGAPGFVPDLPQDAASVAQARADIAAQPPAERLFDVLISRLQTDLPDTLSVARLAGPEAALVLRRASGQPLSTGVAGPYTREGYARYLALRDDAVASMQKDQWVLGADAVPEHSADQLKGHVDAAYFSRYIKAWDALLGDIRVVPLAQSQEGATLVRLLAGAESPLRQLLQGAAAQTTLAGVKPAAAGSGTKNGEPAVPAAESSVTPVDRHFDALRRLFIAAEGGRAPYAAVQGKLAEVSVFLDAVDAARRRGMPPPAGDAVAAIRTEAQDQPAPLAGILDSLAADGGTLALQDERQRLDDLWRGNVVPFCHAAMDGRYPVDAQSTVDMTEDDFSRLFGPGGLINTFFQANLAPYVDMTVRPWRWRPNAAKLHFSRAALQVFQDAATIRDAFFPDGAKTMSVRFELVPLSLDAHFDRFALTLGGQTLQYAHGPARAMAFQWPSRGAAPVARIDYEPAGPDGRSGMLLNGPWALFRLIDQGTLQQVRPDRFILKLELSGKPVTLEVDANSVVNPFALAALHRFRCVNSLQDTRGALAPAPQRAGPAGAAAPAGGLRDVSAGQPGLQSGAR